MRSYIPGGQLQVRKNITHDHKNLWLTPDQYSDTEIERMDSYSMGQGWTIRFTQKHQCHGAMLMLIHAITPNQRWDEQLDDEVTYAVTPYVESDRGNGGFSARSFLQADSELQYKLWLATLQQGISSALHQEISREEDSQAGSQARSHSHTPRSFIMSSSDSFEI